MGDTHWAHSVLARTVKCRPETPAKIRLPVVSIFVSAAFHTFTLYAINEHQTRSKFVISKNASGD